MKRLMVILVLLFGKFDLGSCRISTPFCSTRAIPATGGSLEEKAARAAFKASSAAGSCHWR
jgi:hypothetical protein